MKGWLDKYGNNINANEGTSSAPECWVGEGYSTKGRNYSPAWGGQFAMGGSLPGSVGFTYARTHSPAPSEGPYAKKTLPSAEYGMSYYQHGLDWKPRNISRDGSEVPKNQNAQFVLPRYNMPRAASESTSRTFFDPITKKEKSTATVGQKKKNLQLSSEAMGKAKKAERDEEKARVAERKSAVAAKDKGEAFTLPTGERLTYDQMSPRQKMYVSGKALEQRGRIYEDEESFLDEWVNPLNWIGSSAAGLAKAPLEAQLSNSNLPYIGAVAEPLVEGAFGFDPLGYSIKAYNSPIVKSVGKMAYDIPRAESIKEAVGRVAGIPLKKDIPRMAAEDVKALRQVQEIGRLRATNAPYADQMKYGLENNLPEEHFQKVFGKSREEAQGLLNTGYGEQEAARSAGIRSRIDLRRPSDRGADLDIDVTPEELNQGQRGLMNELFGGTEGLSQEELRDRISALEREIADDDILSLDDLGTSQEEIDAAINSPEGQSLRERFRQLDAEEEGRNLVREPYTSGPITGVDRSDRVQDMIERFPQASDEEFVFRLTPEQQEEIRASINRSSRTIIPGQERSRRTLFQTLGDDWNRYVDQKRPTSQIINSKLENFINKNIQNYPYYSGRVQEKVPSLHLSSMKGGLKDVSKKVSFAPEGIKSGDVFTGSTNTSHSSYLPQLKQIFKYTKGDPQFLGYQPMNTLGFLSGYGYEGGDIAKYLNSEIDEQIKRGIIPKDISRPFQRGEHVMLPHYGVKQNKKGGVVKDNNGYWNPDNWGKAVEIDSPDITMQGVNQPLIGISKQTGEEKVMLPGKDYTFANTKQVIEKPLNKKSTGGWLDKYN